MSTDPPGAGVPNEEGPPVDIDSNARRASGARRSRRKKDDDTTNHTATPESKVKKETKPTRAPRRPREKSMSTAAARKKAKLEQPGDEATGPAGAGAAAPAPTPAATSAASVVSPTTAAPPPPAVPADSRSPPPQLHTAPSPPQPTPPPAYSSPHPPPAARPQEPASRPYQQVHAQPQPQPPPSQPTKAPQAPQRTSGQNFDPIRSAFDNPSPAPTYTPPPHIASPRNNGYRASASPAISSIIDPPQFSNPVDLYVVPPRTSPGYVSSVSSPAPPAMAHTPTHPTLAPSPIPASSPSHGAFTPQPTHVSPYASMEQRPPLQSQPSQLELSSPALQVQQPPAQPKSQSQPPEPSAHISTPPRPTQQSSDAMDIDSKEQPASTTKKEKGTTTAPTSKAPSPKPARAAKEAPKIPQGSGLITNALFGGIDESSKSDARSSPNIIVHVPLQKGNQVINFAQLAEERYGFAALHPRLAAHKERLARVAAAGDALERNVKGGKGASAGESADEDLSLDMDRDSDMDGDISMLGAGPGTNAPSETSDGKKKRRKKVEEYDRDDPFVDDSELAWQEQAAASKDGFFVYSGPLVPEGEKVQVERADGTIKRGRGRGRGTGRGRSIASHPHVPIAAAVPISQDTGLPLRGPGSRGGTSRRARTAKKADQADKHADKHDKHADKHADRSGTTASSAHEGRSGRGGSAAGSSSRGGGGGGARGGKSSSLTTMVDLAPAPPSNSTPNIAPAPSPSPLTGPELVMK
ncbi:hypothetical protein N7462_001549 [Penicillium macrosclerotiorum]|uniref:uncharacterized protein n=1 Tax=Penicillium macrosclerotiorum TaxID=303699 RepID=UPI0025495556|nr:uncharacterized protein N7462_001549 [Penicillium macrosclerotiorum]KAJ5692126.1 hypothetical protein N7462_001549 [Penicillium macrosclerotiorum]